MRYAELVFLALLVAYHAVLLIPRHRRPFAGNYLVFLAGMALAWNLGLEGLRWQTLPAVALLLIDLAVLFPTFATLRGHPRARGIGSLLLSSIRALAASAGLLLAVACAVLSVAFPLPKVELTGGLTPAFRELRFPARDSQPAVDVKVWYPASGDQRSRERPGADPESWQRAAASGLPVYWQAYREHLPSALIRGGRPASPGTRYAVLYAALPAGTAPEEFGYLFEDLASRGFIVAAGGPLPGPVPPAPVFRWEAAWDELLRPLRNPSLWLLPESARRTAALPADTQWLRSTRAALVQLDGEPGDPFFESFDWSRQALWSWGTAPADPEVTRNLGLKAVVAYGTPSPTSDSAVPTLQVTAHPADAAPNRWTLTVPGLMESDLSDAAYLKPYLVLFDLKRRADARYHGALRQYQAAFYQAVLWDRNPSLFTTSVPEVPGLVLSGR